MATTAETIQNYYNTILARTGSAAEVAYWVNQVDNVGISLSQVEADFATSPEALTNVAPIVEMYEADLGRAPDTAGLTYWVGLEESGTSLATIAADIAGSAESQAVNGFTAGAAPTTAFVTSLYESILGRQPESAAVVATWVGSGLSDAQIVAAISGSAEAQADYNSAVTTYLATGGGAAVNTVTLTTGVDNIALTGNNNVVNGTANGILGATFTPGDTITAAAGSTGNVLNLSDMGTGGTWTTATNLAGVTVSGIQTVNLNSAEAVNVDTANSPEGFGGLTNLNVNYSDPTPVGEDYVYSTITAAGTTAISAQDNSLYGYDSEDYVEGGSNINYVANGVGDYPDIYIGDEIAPTGTISVTENVLAGQEGAYIEVYGGTTVTVTENLATNNDSGYTEAEEVDVYGGTLTTSVTVNQTAPIDGSDSSIYNGYVEIEDANYYSGSTQTGTITDVSLSNYDGAEIDDTGLANLTLAGTGYGVDIYDNGAASPSTTLNLTLNGLTDTYGITDEYGEFKTINITTGGTVASSLNGIDDTGLTTLTVTGSQSLSIENEITSLTTVEVSGGAGLDIVLGANTAFTSTSTGTDVVTIFGPATQTITGNGTANEELVWDSAAAPTAALGNVSGFSVLGIGSDVVSGTFDMSKITGFTGFDVQGNTTDPTIALTNVTAGSPLAIDGTFDGTLVYETADSAGATDSLGVTLGAAANTAGFTVNALTAEDGSSAHVGIGTLNITSNASGTSQSNTIGALTDDALSTLSVAGTGGFAVTDAFTTSATGFAINGTSTGTGGIAFTDGITAANLASLTVTGSDAVSLGGLTTDAASVTLTNSGSSTLNVGTLTDPDLTSLTLNGKVAADVTGDTVTTGVTVNGLTDNSNVTVTQGGATASGNTDSITLGNGTNSVTDSAALAGSTVNITVGTGANTITLGGAATNNVTFGAHSSTTADAVTVSSTGTGSFVPAAVITGLNASGADTITFASDTGADLFTSYSTAQLDGFGTGTGTGNPPTNFCCCGQ